MQRRISTTGALLAVLMTAGCDDTPVGPAEVVDEYELAAINDAAPPQVVFENDVLQLHMTEGLMALFDNGTYLQQLNFEQHRASGDSIVHSVRLCKGSYSSTSSSIVLKEKYCDSRTYRGTRDGDTLIFEFSEGVVLTWHVIPEP